MQRKIPLDRIKSSLSHDWHLDLSEVEARQIQYGKNNIVEIRTNKYRELAIETAKDPMIWFLVGTGMLFAILKNYNQAIILSLAAIPLIVMDAFLHWRTQASTRSLSHCLASLATVIRDGLTLKMPAEEIVPGDLVVVDSGTAFPADGIILNGQDLQVDESALTGESFPVKKTILTQFPPEDSEPLIDSQYLGFAGTRLLTGRALLRVVYTGQETIYGEIVTSALSGIHERTPLQKTIARLVYYLIGITVIVCIILALVRLLQGFGFLDAILSAATLAVAALPDEYPVVFTFFLGLGVYRLAQKKVLVRRAVSVENIGRITCICSDKTGTITEGRFRLTQYYPESGIDEDQLLFLAAIASRSETHDPLDLAIVQAANEKRITMPERMATFPFTEVRKRETSIISYNSTQSLVATKGSPETILALSALPEEEKQSWLKRVFDLAAEGYKVIACAQNIVDQDQGIIEPESNYKFLGLLLFLDPPRKEVFSAVQNCLGSGIHILMITGDHPETARAVANLIGLGKGNPNVISANEAQAHLEGNGDFLRTVDVIARAIPSQKLSIVTALQSAGDIVAVTGDGVNDVPALKKADIGIAMGEHGTQSAREIADIVLLDDNFSSIVNAISEGRQLFKNLLASYKYLLIIHMPFVISTAVIPLLGYPLLYYPIHIVWIELFIHPTSMLVFQDLPASNKLVPVERKSKPRFFSKKDWYGIWMIGIFSTVFVIISYIFILKMDKNVEHARGFTLASLGFISAAVTVGLTKLQTQISRVVVASSIFFSIFLIQIPVLAKFFSLTPLSFYNWMVIAAAFVVTLILSSLLSPQ